MTSLNESFLETSERERQAVISAQDLAAALQHEMSQATTACESWKSEVIRRRKEVAEQNTKRTAGRNSLHCSSVLLPPSRMDCSQPFTQTERVDSPLQTSRPTVGNPCEHIPSTSSARTRDQLPMKENQKGKKQIISSVNYLHHVHERDGGERQIL